MLKLKNILSFRKRIPAKVVIFLFFVFSFPAYSQRAFNIRTPSLNIRGDAILIGNRNLIGANAAMDDDKTTMTLLDLDGDPVSTSSSTSADLVLPAGSSIVWAGLYWAGRNANAARNMIKFKKSTGAYTVYTATQVDNGNTISGITTENHYQCFLDMTAFMEANGPGTYWGADIKTTQGNGSLDPAGTGYYGGWAMIVIYQDLTQPYRNITVYDGYSSVWGGNGTGTVTVPVSGFLTPSSGPFTTKLGIIAWEGDKNITNDKIRLNVNDDPHNISDANNPATNFFNGTITSTPRNPNTVQNWGVDFDYITSNISLPLNSTSTTIYFNTSGDFYLPGAVVFSVDINPVVLPIEFFSFDVKKINNSAMLEWATISENNNEYFQIERSINAFDWEAAGRMEGQGHSTSYQFYKFEDVTAAEFALRNETKSQTLYYRLKQVDYNGKSTFSEIKAVHFEAADKFDFAIYPNPATASATINFYDPADSTITMKMSDSNGKIIFNTQLSAKNCGEFDLRHLKSGVYYIEAKDEKWTISKRFVIE